MQLYKCCSKKKVNTYRVCTNEINEHTSTHLQMCNIVQLVTHSGITAYSQSFQSTINQTYIQSEYVHTRLYTCKNNLRTESNAHIQLLL